MALVFAIVGFYQYETRDIFQNPKVINANAYAPFFRVNSVFWDPSVYGRFLVLAMVPSIVLIVRGRSLRRSLVAAAALVVTWLGLLISYSQSSFAALLVVVIGAAFVAWRWRALVAVVLAVAVLAGISVAQPQVRRSLQHHTSHGLNDATSGRSSLVANGIRIAVHHPLTGVGVGGFKRAYAERVKLQGQGPEEGRVAHDARDGRGRDRARRARALRARAWARSSSRRSGAAAGRCRSSPGSASSRSSATRSSTTRSSRIR